MDADHAAITERLKGTLSDLLGVRLVEATPERVVAELTYRQELTTWGGAAFTAAPSWRWPTRWGRWPPC